MADVTSRIVGYILLGLFALMGIGLIALLGIRAYYQILNTLEIATRDRKPPK